jgi:Ca2+-transporting ATPase
VFGELFRAFASRSPTKLFWEVGAFTNLRLLGVVVGSALIQIGIHHVPGLEALFQIGDLSISDCLLTLLLGLIPVTAIELTKLARRLGTGGMKARTHAGAHS